MSKGWTIVHISGGNIVNKTAVINLLLSCKDGKHLLEISSANKRSSQQNRYYFGLVVPLIQKGIKDMGTELTKEETHEFLKAEFNFSELTNFETGHTLTVPRSTTALNKEQFSEYIEKIQRFAAEFLNIVIPDPGVQTTMSYD